MDEFWCAALQAQQTVVFNQVLSYQGFVVHLKVLGLAQVSSGKRTSFKSHVFCVEREKKNKKPKLYGGRIILVQIMMMSVESFGLSFRAFMQSATKT